MLDATLKQQPQTINKKIAVLKAFRRFAVERGYASINPTDGLRRKQTTTERLEPKWLDRKAQSWLLHEVKNESNEKKRARNYAIVQLMLSCGLRVDEVVNLHVNDLDPNRRTITVHAGKPADRIRVGVRGVRKHTLSRGRGAACAGRAGPQGPGTPQEEKEDGRGAVPGVDRERRGCAAGAGGGPGECGVARTKASLAPAARCGDRRTGKIGKLMIFVGLPFVF